MIKVKWELKEVNALYKILIKFKIHKYDKIIVK